MTCHCDAYPFPHRLGGGECDECGCPDSPECEHCIRTADPFGTCDWWKVEFERRQLIINSCCQRATNMV